MKNINNSISNNNYYYNILCILFTCDYYYYRKIAYSFLFKLFINFLKVFVYIGK